MSQDYDKIFKENIEEIILPLAYRLLDLPWGTLEEIPDDVQTTIERRPDFLKKVVHPNAELDFILHIEFQLANQGDMLERMLEYYGLLYRKYRLPVRQYVFYLGTSPATMPTQLAHPNLTFSYRIISLTELEAAPFIDSDNPAEVILAILSHFRRDEARPIIQRILLKLKQLRAQGVKIDKYLKQLEVLSKLRNLQEETVKQISAMPLVYDLKTDIRFLQGKEEGVQEGISAEKQAIIKRMLQQRVLSHQAIAEVTETSVEYVKEIEKTL